MHPRVEGVGAVSFVRRHQRAILSIGLGAVAALGIGEAFGAAAGSAVLFAVVFVAAIVIGRREGRYLELDTQRAFTDQVLEVHHERVTTERVRSWVPRVLTADDEAGERVKRGA